MVYNGLFWIIVDLSWFMLNCGRCTNHHSRQRLAFLVGMKLFFSDVMVIGHSQTVVDYGWPHSPPTFFLSPRGCQPRSQRFRKPAIWRLESMMGMLVEFLAASSTVLRREVKNHLTFQVIKLHSEKMTMSFSWKVILQACFLAYSRCLAGNIAFLSS